MFMPKDSNAWDSQLDLFQWVAISSCENDEPPKDKSYNGQLPMFYWAE